VSDCERYLAIVSSFFLVHLVNVGSSNVSQWLTTIAVLVFNGLTIFLCLSNAAPHVVTEMAPLAQMP
jgi:hypothetical protein